MIIEDLFECGVITVTTAGTVVMGVWSVMNKVIIGREMSLKHLTISPLKVQQV